MTGGAFGSIFAQLFHLTRAERKTLLVAGAAGGMAAVFATPVAAVLLAVEFCSLSGGRAVLFQWHARPWWRRSCACRCSARCRSFQSRHTRRRREESGSCGVGIAAGFGLGFADRLVYACEDLFQTADTLDVVAGDRRRVRRYRRCDRSARARVWDTTRSMADARRIIGAALIGLTDWQRLRLVHCLGSGTSGGVLAPLLIIGGALGAGLGNSVQRRRCRPLGAGRDGGDDGRHDALAVNRNRLRPRADP